MSAELGKTDRWIMGGHLGNTAYDSLPSNYCFKDFSFSKVRERYWTQTHHSMEDKLFESFGIVDAHGILTNAGALLADCSPVWYSRLFCTRWNGLDKGGGAGVDALDSAEYSGSLIKLFEEGLGFVQRNQKKAWMKTPGSRIEMPDYCERSVYEALVNGLVHRDYHVLGSEVHIDMYDDRLIIVSPGGMFDGSRVQNQDILRIAPRRRNPVLAGIFEHLGYMESSGNGFRKIMKAYQTAYKYRQELKPQFYSDKSTFWVELFNLNYKAPEKIALNTVKIVLNTEKEDLERYVSGLRLSAPTKQNICSILAHFKYDAAFSRADVIKLCDLAPSSAGKLIKKMKALGLLRAVPEQGRGKYLFIRRQQ